MDTWLHGGTQYGRLATETKKKKQSEKMVNRPGEGSNEVARADPPKSRGRSESLSCGFLLLLFGFLCYVITGKKLLAEIV